MSSAEPVVGRRRCGIPEHRKQLRELQRIVSDQRRLLVEYVRQAADAQRDLRTEQERVRAMRSWRWFIPYVPCRWVGHWRWHGHWCGRCGQHIGPAPMPAWMRVRMAAKRGADERG